MLLRHPGEQGVCIDHFAALVVDGEDYAVLALDGKPGTLVAGGTEPDFSGAGTPAIWLKSIEGGRVVAKAAPAAGKLADILRKPTAVVDDARIARAREENPSNVERP
jgi:dipeptidase E